MSLGATTNIGYDTRRNTLYFPDGRELCQLTDHAVERVNGFKIADHMNLLLNPWAEERQADIYEERERREELVEELKNDNSNLEDTLVEQNEKIKELEDKLEGEQGLSETRKMHLDRALQEKAEWRERFDEAELALQRAMQRMSSLERLKDEEIAHLRSLMPQHRPIRMRLKRTV